MKTVLVIISEGFPNRLVYRLLDFSLHVVAVVSYMEYLYWTCDGDILMLGLLFYLGNSWHHALTKVRRCW